VGGTEITYAELCAFDIYPIQETKNSCKFAKNLSKDCEDMHKICKLTKNEATTSLYLMRRFVYLHMAQFRVSESYTCFLLIT